MPSAVTPAVGRRRGRVLTAWLGAALAVTPVWLLSGCSGERSAETPDGPAPQPTRTVQDFATNLADTPGVDLRFRDGQVVVADLRAAEGEALQQGIESLDWLPAVSEVFLPGNALNAETIQILRRCPALKRLRVIGPGCDDKVVAGLAELPDLIALTLQETEVTDRGAEVFKRLPQLRDVSLMRSPVTDACLDSLTGCRQLTKLNLRGTDITGENFGPIESLPIEDLELAETEFGSPGMGPVAELDRLRKLNLWLTRIDDSGLAKLQGRARLTWLNLDNCARITDASVDVLLSLTGLELLHVGGTSISPDQVLRFAELPELKTLFVTRLGVDNQTAEQLKSEASGLEKLEY